MFILNIGTQHKQNATVTGKFVVNQEEQNNNEIRPDGNQNEYHGDGQVTVNKTWGWNNWVGAVTESTVGVDLGVDLPSINEPVTKITGNHWNNSINTTTNTGSPKPSIVIVQTYTNVESNSTSTKGIDDGRSFHFANIPWWNLNLSFS